MFRKSTLLAAITGILLAGYPGFLIGAEGVSPAEAKLRESLRAALLQARTAEAARATAEVRAGLREFGLRFGEGSPTDEELTRLPSSYADHGGAFWAVSDGGRLLATCGVFPVAAGTFELRKMYVRREARGLGLGKRLLEESLAWLRDRNARQLVLDTTEQMERAIAFYEANGFVRDDAQKRGSRCSRGYALQLRPDRP